LEVMNYSGHLTMPWAYGHEAHEGPSKGYVVKLNEMLDEYYNLRGWIDGRPTKAKLEELELKWIAYRLEEEGLLPG